MVERLSFARLGLVAGEMGLLLMPDAPVSIKGLISINVHCTFRSLFEFTYSVRF